MIWPIQKRILYFNKKIMTNSDIIKKVQAPFLQEGREEI